MLSPGSWVIRLTAAALICTTLCTLTGENSRKGIVRMVCGIFLTLTALQPLSGFTLPDLEGLTRDYLEQGMQTAALGEDWAARQRQARIKQELESYILDKAASMHARLDVCIHLDGAEKPVSAELFGTVAPEVQEEMAALIAKDLGIAREDQKWTS